MMRLIARGMPQLANFIGDGGMVFPPTYIIGYVLYTIIYDTLFNCIAFINALVTYFFTVCACVLIFTHFQHKIIKQENMKYLIILYGNAK